MNHSDITDAQVARLPLAGARADLLEEIMATPTLERTESRVPDRRRPHRLVAMVATAAAVSAVAGGSLVLSNRSAPPQSQDPEIVQLYSAADVAAAEETPRFVVDLPGWSINEVYGFAKESGSVTYSDGDRDIEFTWYPASEYRSLYEDRTLGTDRPTEKITVASLPGILVTYTADHDYAVLFEPRGDSVVELRIGASKDFNAWRSEAMVRNVLGHVREVSAEAWLKLMPTSVVTPANESAALTEALADIPLPPGLSKADLSGLGVNERYNFGARVTGEVACGWIGEWVRARDARDDAATARALDALRGARNWAIVKEMGNGGFAGQMLWAIDEVADGRVPPEYRVGLGCD